MLSISTQNIKMGFETKRPEVEISQPRGELYIKSRPAKMNITKDKLEIKIDQVQCFAEAGLKTNRMLIEEYAELGKQYAQEGVARIAREGDQLAKPKNSKAIANIAAGHVGKMADFNIKFIPQSKPVIDFTGGNMDIRWEIGDVELDSKINKPQFAYKPGSLNIYVEQYPEVKIEVIDERV